MRFWVTFVTVVLGMNLAGWAQTKPPSPLKPRPSSEFKVKDDQGKPGPAYVPPATATKANAKSLQSVERERPARTVSHSAKKSPVIKPEKESPTPKINFNGSSGGQKAGFTGKGPDPYRGRLKQKGAHH